MVTSQALRRQLVWRVLYCPLPLLAIPEDGAWNVSRVVRDQIFGSERHRDSAQKSDELVCGRTRRLRIRSRSASMWILDRMRELAGRLFKQAAGQSSSLVDAAARRLRRWFQGKAAARTALV
jgi:hypothetical protein